MCTDWIFTCTQLNEKEMEWNIFMHIHKAFSIFDKIS